MRLTKNQVFEAKDLTTKMVDMSKWWGGEIEIQAFSAKQGIEFHKKVKDTKSDDELVLHMIVSCCVDENRDPMFTPEDIVELGKKSWEPLEHLFNECLKINKLSKDTDIEQEAKNS